MPCLVLSCLFASSRHVSLFLFSRQQKYNFSINDLETVEEIGSGTCGQVCKMKHKETGTVVAVKVGIVS